MYRENEPTLTRTWDRLRARIAAYPPSLRGLGESFLGWAGPGYFSLPDAAPLMHLPIWMGQRLGADSSAREALDDILEATALAYAYVRIQDNVVDEPGGRGHPPLLLVANGFLWDALALFRGRADAHFWDAARCAWFAFSEETESERRQITSPAPYPHAAFAQHARKCALAEVPLYAVMGASGDWRGQTAVPRLIHALARSFGCFNDVIGHERDLVSGAGIWLVAAARAHARSTTGLVDPPIEEVRRALLAGDHMERLIEESIATLQDARGAGAELEMPAMEAYVAQRTARLVQVQSRLAFLRLGAALAA